MAMLIRNGIQYGFDSKNILNTVSECVASENPEQIPSVKVIKEINNSLEELKAICK